MAWRGWLRHGSHPTLHFPCLSGPHHAVDSRMPLRATSEYFIRSNATSSSINGKSLLTPLLFLPPVSYHARIVWRYLLPVAPARPFPLHWFDWSRSSFSSSSTYHSSPSQGLLIWLSWWVLGCDIIILLLFRRVCRRFWSPLIRRACRCSSHVFFLTFCVSHLVHLSTVDF